VIRRRLAAAIASGLVLLKRASPSGADPEDDHTRVILVRSASWDAATGAVRATISWNREEWRSPNVNDLSLAVLARTGEEWRILRSKPVKTNATRHSASYTFRLPESKRAAARSADQLLVAATQSHADKPGTFEIAWYASRTIAGKPLQAGLRAESVSCASIYRGAVIEECAFYGANLSNVDLRNADLNDTLFDAANFSGANLSRAFMARAHCAGANLAGADMRRAVLVRSHLVGADASRANLSGTDMTDANLAGINLHGAKLSRAMVANADLRGANVSGAHLAGADFSFSNLTDASFIGATVSAATTFFEVTYCRTVMPDGTVNNANC
jgi:uncharacterized protein YjbI with pentapeptide repeats